MLVDVVVDKLALGVDSCLRKALDLPPIEGLSSKIRPSLDPGRPVPRSYMAESLIRRDERDD